MNFYSISMIEFRFIKQSSSQNYSDICYAFSLEQGLANVQLIMMSRFHCN